MYWPIGVPRIFAHDTHSPQPQVSDDGIPGIHARGDQEEHEQLRDDDKASASEQKSRSHASEKEDPSRSSEQEEEKQRNGSAETQQKNGQYVEANGKILGMRVARNGQLFATITETSLSVWQTHPTAVLACVVRSSDSLKSYGPNVGLLLRPDADISVLITSLGYLITYSISIHPEHRAYMLNYEDGDRRQARRHSVDQHRGYFAQGQASFLEGGGLVPDVSLRFSMVIKFDAGISKALALDHELIVATREPAAIQCIRWTPDRDGSQTSTELLDRMEWLNSGAQPEEIIYDRPMNLFVFVMEDGDAYAVQRTNGAHMDSKNKKSLFKGHCFHRPRTHESYAVKASINSRFSLAAIGCADGSIRLYAIRDYTGGITLLRKLPSPVSLSSTSAPTILTYSPDGYCLFAGYETGWTTWSVFGQAGGSSFTSDLSLAQQTGDSWLLGTSDAFWIGGGSDLVMLGPEPQQLWILEFARSALTGCFTSANICRAILQTSSGFMVYRGHTMPNLMSISTDVSLWEHVESPIPYVTEQWPLRSAVVSPDGRYLAIAGQRGLAHYSFSSGRWKTFEDLEQQNDFFVRGGMCWHHHILIVATESSDAHELRLYSRETSLDHAKILHVEKLQAPVVHLSSSGDDSILVYTYDNVLDHYVVAASKKSVHLVKVGQITLNGIIRAPSRVRSVSWVVPNHQLDNGDPAQDVAVASVFFLVDGKFVLLQPSTSEDGALRYDMKMIAQRVEWYTLARDSPATNATPMNSPNGIHDTAHDRSLADSLWIYDGTNVKVWPDVNELLSRASQDSSRDIKAPIRISLDFYPLAALLRRGIIFGAEAELVQRRDASFALFRAVARTSLYLPNVLQYYLEQYDPPAALHLSHHYQNLPYFTHALEVLLHNVLDDEVEHPPANFGSALLPAVLSFLSTFPEYLEIIVQCARKTELRSWRTLFEHLPPPIELFETSLTRGALKTAGGYLLVLHNLADVESTSPQVIRLLRAARTAEDWDLCKELARFLMALDESGETLQEALELVDLASPIMSRRPSIGTPLKSPREERMPCGSNGTMGLGIADG